MIMQKQILSELKELRNILSRVVGTSDHPILDQFYTEASDKAAKDLKNVALLIPAIFNAPTFVRG